MGWQWHQLNHMQIICTLFQTDNHASTSSLNFLQAGCSSCHPTNSVKALKAEEQLKKKSRDHRSLSFTCQWKGVCTCVYVYCLTFLICFILCMVQKVYKNCCADYIVLHALYSGHNCPQRRRRISNSADTSRQCHWETRYWVHVVIDLLT